MPVRPLLLCLLAGALAAPAAAQAYRPPTVADLGLTLKIAGTHTVRWHSQDAAYPDPNRSWTLGSGTQTLRFAAPKAVRYLGTALTGTAPDGTVLSPLAIVPLTTAPIPSTVHREGTWQPNDPLGCDSEGHCDDSLFVPLHRPAACPDRPVDLPVTATTAKVEGTRATYRLTADVAPASLDSLWTSCPPDMDGSRRPLALARPASVPFAGAIRAIRHLRRGQRLTLRGSVRRGAIDGAVTTACPAMDGPGLRECATTKVSIEVRRVR